MSKGEPEIPKKIAWSGMTHRGKVRANNEDAFLALTFDAREVRYLGKVGEASLENADFVFAVSDGTDSVTALFAPMRYGAAVEDALYAVDGIYGFADGSASRSARLVFGNGELLQVVGFTNDDGNGAPREIIPQTGDTFTVLERWMDLDAAGQASEQVTQEGGTLTFSDQLFTWEEMDAPTGAYLVGFIVEDLDGNRIQAYQAVTVE